MSANHGSANRKCCSSRHASSRATKSGRKNCQRKLPHTLHTFTHSHIERLQLFALKLENKSCKRIKNCCILQLHSQLSYGKCVLRVACLSALFFPSVYSFQPSTFLFIFYKLAMNSADECRVPPAACRMSHFACRSARCSHALPLFEAI